MKDFWTSISAEENAFGKDDKAGGCVRRWWLDKICKLPKPERTATMFGDVFHAVLARFYMADDRGLDSTGRPVNLFPEDWKSVKSRFAKEDEDAIIVENAISDLDEILIHSLIEKSVSEGILIRIPGRLVEREISRPLYTDPITGQKIILKGFIDLETSLSVEDHKTSKATKWLVSAAGLKTNVQMITYAWDKYERGHQGGLWLAHNNYVKDYADPQVIQRSAQVDKDYVYDYFNQVILQRFKAMQSIALKYPAELVNRWRELCPPNDPEKECNHYYGHTCPYISICSGQCDVALYRAKYEALKNQERNKTMSLLDVVRKQNQGILNQPPVAAAPVAQPQVVQPIQQQAIPNPQDVMAQIQNMEKNGYPVRVAQPTSTTPPNPQDVLAKIQAMKQQQQGGTIPAAIPASTPAPVAQPVQAPVVDNRPKAPWHFPGCMACKDNPYGGFNSQGGPCSICDAQNEKNGRLKSQDYDWDYINPKTGQKSDPTKDPEAVLTFFQKPGATPINQPVQPETVQNQLHYPTSVSQVTPTSTPAPAQIKTRKPRTKKQTAPVASTPAPIAQTTPDTAWPLVGSVTPTQDALEPEPETTDRLEGFTLLIGCTVFKGRQTITADDVLTEALSQIEKTAGKTAAEIEHFTLLAGLDAQIPTLAADLSGAGLWVTSFQPTKGTALARLVDGLRQYAQTVIVNIGA